MASSLLFSILFCCCLSVAVGSDDDVFDSVSRVSVIIGLAFINDANANAEANSVASTPPRCCCWWFSPPFPPTDWWCWIFCMVNAAAAAASPPSMVSFF